MSNIDANTIRKVTVYLPEELYDKLADLKSREHRSLSSQIVVTLQYAIEKMEEKR